MRVPTRKPGKYTHVKLDPHLTENKFKDIKKKLEKLKLSRPKAALEVKRLAEMGDFSENAAYQMAKGRLRSINYKIDELEDHLKSALIIKRNHGADVVKLGSTVTVEVKGKQKKYLILGSSETNPSAGIISHNSPLGSALMNKKIGQIIKIKLLNSEVECKIISIE